MVALTASALLIASSLVSATPPEEGLTQTFAPGNAFTETLDVTVKSASSQADAPDVTSSYVLTLSSVTQDVESSTTAIIDSRVTRVTSSTTIGDQFATRYDSSERSKVASIDAANVDADMQAAMWSAFRDTGIMRAFHTDGSIEHQKTIGLPIETRDTDLAKAFDRSLTSMLSCALPAGPLESWTDELTWPTIAGDLPVLRLYSYVGREQNLHRIEMSAASVNTDGAAPTNEPTLVAKGVLQFDATLGRISAIDLVVEMKQPHTTRTNIAWRLVPEPTRLFNQ